MNYALSRALLFRLEPELSHRLALQGLRWLGPLVHARQVVAPRRLLGLTFANPVGVAAGLDKSADYIDALARLGFGFIEVGTVTPQPQAGNPRPRLFRLPQAEALINRMGFNNKGVEHLIGRLQRTDYRGVIGVNIGKNRVTPLTRAVDDYVYCLRAVYPYAHYVTVNISSPNTPGLRDLQYGTPLRRLLGTLKREQNRLADHYGRYVPLALKIAPDIADADIPRIADTLLEHRIDAVIATNTTAARPDVMGLHHADEAGGLSGAPLRQRASDVLQQFARIAGGALPLIGVGGIMSGSDACDRQARGASLVQLYTGLVYRGPDLVSEVATALATAEPGGASHAPTQQFRDRR